MKFQAVIILILITVIIYVASTSYLEKREDLAAKYNDNLFMKMRIGLSQIFVKLADWVFHEEPLSE